MKTTKTIFSGHYSPVPAELFAHSAFTPTDAQMDWARVLGGQIYDKLSAIKIEVLDVIHTIGPTTTTFMVKPTPSVRMSRLRNIEGDISLALGERCRVIAPMPGIARIGIEVPTRGRTIVGFGQVCGKATGELPISLGVTPSGQPLCFDLAKMPHLLIAGASGQGKSVCLNVIIVSLLAALHPRDLNLYLIDPKRIEFSDYEALGTTRILKRLDRDIEGAGEALAEICEEMDRRYKLMQDVGSRKLSDYNAKASERLPYIVGIVDEFSDLMMSGDGRNREVETDIIRIAQLGRAAGIHLILSTQRPDAEVITGLIKANFPARIAFRTSTSIDSKIILDRGGAQALTGAGDMLMMVNGETTRAQCAYLSDSEIIGAVDHCLEQLVTLKIDDVTEGDVIRVVDMDTDGNDLMELSVSEDWRVRRSVASNPNISSFIMEAMARDCSDAVRYAVASNPNLSLSVREMLMKDETAEVRAMATRNITNNKG